jgi:uncharacterized protein YdeI (YjbR/CyaY-like superfamily)
MKSRSNPEVDAFIAAAPDYARPILTKIRAAFHAGCPEIEERIKWGMPSFEYKGILGGMAVFKNHVSFGFWKSRLMPDFEKTFSRPGRASAMGAHVESLADLPPQGVLVDFVKEAKRLNDEAVKDPKRAKQLRSPRVAVPADFRAALAKSAKARTHFAAFAPSHRREYVKWITEAKRPETRARRLATAIVWLAQSKTRNWKYQ